mgnify:CR=1 FL=1
MNLAPYENYVLTNDIIEGDARVRGRRAGRAYLLSKRKGEMRKNESGKHAGNRLGECMDNRSGEYAGGAGEPME